MGQMVAIGVAPVQESDQVRAISTIVSAFTDDPVERWLYPELEQYLTHFADFVAAFGGEAFSDQTVWGPTDLSAVAVWLQPGAEPDADKIVSVLSGTVSTTKQDDTFAVLEQMDEAHPTYPHWYLPWLGVKRGLQGKGLGRQLLRHCLSMVDESRLPAYLETPNPRTVPFYETHGFEVTAQAQAGGCPPMTLMLRAAR
jgi:ribosomal protein S18 acetylase RimI-like enzyme